MKDSIDLKKENFKLAFAVRDLVTNEVKQDPSLVEWKGIIFEKVDGVEKAIHEIDAKICSERDQNQFYEVSSKDKVLFKDLL